MTETFIINHKGMTTAKEIVIRKRPEADPVEFVLEIHKRDSYYKTIYMLQGFSSLSPSEVDALRYGLGIQFDENNVFTMPAGKFYGLIKHNGELAKIAEFTHRCARLR